MRRRHALLLVILLLAAAGVLAARASRPEPPTATVERGDLVISVDVEGTVEALDPVTLGPPSISGVWNYRIAFMVPEGAEVREGQRVLAFDTEELDRRLRQRVAERDSAAKEIDKRHTDLAKQREQVELQLSEAEAKLRRAQLQLETPENLMAANELAQQRIDRDLAQAEIEHLEERLELLDRQAAAEITVLEERRSAAAARVDKIESDLERMVIEAPRGGIVIYSSDWEGEKVKVGDQVWVGRSILEIPDLERLRAAGSVAEADLSELEVGQPVSFRLDAHPDVRYNGRIDKIGRTVQRRSPRDPRRVIRIEIGLDRTDPERMRPGLRFQGEVETERRRDLLLLPAGAVFATAEGPVVYRETFLGAEAVRPKLGRVTSERVEVVSGLAEGDRVLLEAPEGGSEGEGS
jgi:multidrug efflux pump subunit AcrA (membrane-fusion protein)